MFEITTNIDKNRIYVSLGKIEKSEAERIYNVLEKELAKMEKGFTSVIDITDFEPADLNEGLYARKIQKRLASEGLSVSIRVNRKSKQSHFKTDRKPEATLVKSEFGYLTGTAATMADAERLLDEVNKIFPSL